jgi:uncharacterized protein (UPF0276 family)
MTMPSLPRGAGLGLRRALLDAFDAVADDRIDFIELAPENWIGVGGRFRRRLHAVAERFPVLLHGLSLDIGGQRPLDLDLIDRIKRFKRDSGALIYSEHLTSCADDGHLYDLLPIPFTAEAVHHVAARVREVQDRLGERIALENASYYLSPTEGLTPAPEMSEAQFIRAVLEEADCDLLLDVNNIVVNSINHGYDAETFLRQLPLERARYIHVAGHYVEADDLRIDTHGMAVIDPVWQLLAQAYALCGPLPTLLERDFNFPPFGELLDEVAQVRRLQSLAACNPVAAPSS